MSITIFIILIDINSTRPVVINISYTISIPISLVFFTVLQLSQIFSAQEVLDYAAGRGARAKAVGLDDFMVHKTVRIGSIPNAGRMEWPVVAGGPAATQELESSRIPFYLGATAIGAFVGEFNFLGCCCFCCHDLVLGNPVCFFKANQALHDFFQRRTTQIVDTFFAGLIAKVD